MSEPNQVLGPANMDAPSTQPSLLLRLRDRGDARAWREFDRRYGELVIGYCRGCGLQLSDAEDVRQLVMSSLVTAMNGFDYQPSRGRFRDYLRRVVRSAVARQLTRHTGREIALDTDVLERVSPAADDASDDRWEQQWVRSHCRRALRELRRSFEPQSVDVFDRLLAGESNDAIESALSMTPEAVRKAKQRVKDRLREIVARQIREEDDHA
jgi:RNA polymerase sigma factor (sigma-70 family)